MSAVDERVVKMVFDNSEFTNKIGDAITSINQLNKSTDEIASNTKGINEMGKAFEQSEISATKAGFHISDVWEKTTRILEYQIANKIVNIAKKIGNAMTFEGVSDGFKEYELKMGSVQTILAGTGESLEKVNQYLEELNKYSDQTIYSFADMTNNIGKFTNAGVKLGDAVAAIKGIANEAARSGANANEASRAMYNFSQALSAGYVKLIDWKSIENANMATKEFKDTLLEVATSCETVKQDSDGMYKVLSKNAQGKAMDGVISATKNFNDSLSYQWMTTDVLTKTMKIYATDVTKLGDVERAAYENELKMMGFSQEQIKKFETLGTAATAAASEVKTFTMLIDTLKEAIGSGWAQTWEILIGDFEEAKALWTEVSNVLGGFIDKMSDSRNTMLKQWDWMNGRVRTIEALKNAFHALIEIVKPIKDALTEVFKPLDAWDLIGITKGVQNFSEKFLKFAQEVAPKIKGIATGVFSLIDMGLQFVGAFTKALGPVIKFVWQFVDSILGVIANFGEFLGIIDKLVKKMGLFDYIFNGILSLLNSFIKSLAPAVRVIETIVVGLFTVGEKLFSLVFSGISGIVKLIATLVNSFKESVGPVKSFGEIVQSAFDKINEGLDNLKKKTEGIKPFFEGLKSIFEKIGSVIGTVFKKLGEAFGSFSFSGNGNGIATIVNLILAAFSGGFLIKLTQISNIVKSVGDIFENIGEVFESFNKRIKADTLKKNAEAIAILAGSIVVVSLIDSEKLAGATTAITAMMFGLAGAMAVLMKAVNSFSISDIKKSFSFLGHEIFGTTGQTINMAVQLGAVSKALVAFGAAVLEMSIALKAIAKVAESGHLWDSFAVLSLMLAELTGIALILSKFSGDKAVKGAGSVVVLSVALNAAVSALKKVAEALDTSSSARIWESFGLISALLVELSAIAFVLGKFGGNKGVAGGLAVIEITAALLLVVKALKDVSHELGTEGQKIWESFGVISAILGVLTIVSVALSKFAGFSLLGGVGAIAAAAALLVVVQSLKQCNDLLKQTDNHVWEAFGLIAASLGVLAIELTAMVAALPGAAALVVASLGLIELAGAFKALSSVIETHGGDTWEAFGLIAATLGVMAIGLTAMVAALPGAAALIVAAAGLSALAGAIKLFAGLDTGETITGLLKFVTVVSVMAGLSAALAAVVPTMVLLAAGISALSIAMGLAGASFILFSAGAQAVSAVLPLAVDVLERLIGVMISMIPELAKALADALVVLAKTIVEYGPIFGECVVEVIREILKVIYESTYEIGKGIVAVIVSVLRVIAEGIPVICAAISDIFIAILKTIAIEIPRLADAGAKCVIAFVAGIAKSISDNTDDMLTAVDLMLEAIGYAVLDWISHLPIIGALIPQELKKGILEGQVGVTKAAEDLMNKTIDVLELKEKEAEDAVKGVSDAAEDEYTGSNKNKVVNAANEMGSETVEAVAGEDKKKALESNLSDWKTMLGDLFTGSDAEQNLDWASAFGDGLSGNFADGLEGNTDDIMGWLNGLINKGKEAANQMQIVENYAKSTTPEIKRQREEVMLLDGDFNKINKSIEKSKLVKKQDTDATKEQTNATQSLGSATKNATEPITELIDVEDYGYGVIKAFAETYGHLYNTMSDDDAWRVAKYAVEEFAISAYDATGKAEGAAKKSKEAKDYLLEMSQSFMEIKESLINSMGSAFSGDSFFQVFETKTEKSMDDILHAMHTNIDGVTDWSNKLAELGEKGVRQGLLQQLAELGPKGFEYVNAFSNATTEQIQQANEMFSEAGRLKVEQSSKIVASYANAGIMAIFGFRDGMLGEMVAAEEAANSLGVTTLNELKDALGIHSPSEETRKIGVYAVEGLRNGIDNQTARAQVLGVIKMLCDKVVNSFSEQLSRGTFFEFGKDISLGLANGIESQIGAVREAARKISEAASVTTTKFNLIKSPSRLYRQYGGYISEGFALGIEDGITTVEDSAYAMSEAIRDTIETAESIAEGDMELHPVISPVLDLSEVQANAELIGKLFPSQSLAMASSIGIGKDNYVADGSTSAPVAPASINVTQNNYSPKALDRYEIYRQTSNLVSQLKGAMA